MREGTRAADEPACWRLPEDRLFDPSRARIARGLYDAVRTLPLVCPHTHVDAALLAGGGSLGTPTEVFVTRDHYVCRMLYSQGMRPEDLGFGAEASDGDQPRRVWQHFAESFHLFWATPSGLWLADTMIHVFGVTSRLTGDTAQEIYDELEEKLASADYSARALLDRFGVEVLCTTDEASDPLASHRALQSQGWGARVRPTFRPDAVLSIEAPTWRSKLTELELAAAVEIDGYRSFLEALRERRAAFAELGAVATDHGATSPSTQRLGQREIEAIFARALRGEVGAGDGRRFMAHTLLELAHMSVDDGLVMQLHAGSLRNHDRELFERFGPDMGGDIPVRTEWTRNLRPLLNECGRDARFRLIAYTLDAATWSRELAPLAGHYPALRLGAPWWFLDSPLATARYLDAVVETAGLRNLAGFNDDARSLPSIPARHDAWRRVASDWLAKLVVLGILDEGDAAEAARALAYDLPRDAYRLAPA